MTKFAASVKNLRLTYPGDQELRFKDLSISFKKGEKVLLLGPSGCGKSTFLQVLSGLIPNSIEVPVKAEEIMLPDSWGYVFQDPDTQFCMPYVDEEIAFVLENLRIPREKMPERIRTLLAEVGLEFEDIHTSIQTLSGGMKQRLAIASVLALDPDVLFLDEPTAMLDPQGTTAIWDTVKKVGEDKTLIIVEHKLDHVLDMVDRIVLFNTEGEIIADGKKDYILSHYKKTLKELGVWYPGVWVDYLHSNPRRAVYERKAEQIIELNDFKGLRKKSSAITVPAASIASGEWIAITGTNGAGKSTLLLSLMQFLKTKGSYTLFGNSVKKAAQVTEHLTYVFQNPEFQFVTNSVYDEVAYALRLDKMDEKMITEEVNERLDCFGLSRLRKHHPYQLSIGQKRRLSVAASIIKSQPVLLLDEPTFGQDSKNTFALLELLEGYREKGTTILMVTHDEMIARHFATRVWKIESGQLMNDSFNVEKELVNA
ncbi:ABC transporter ATP-binding protein [Alkalihalobacillus sp. AL-G]|uniref:ABC transporter ATP-binding protein n=1 Tax=Alkalihalobacillus sp. AL-G TaxID=2926399 RepID=UPI00272B98B7|nr:ABC transporter ATP-binding protein [Alkalihalobacillus sp. AL-G]WLD93891.1 energy-coupling factor ABC transporter ATP-binding protein [Alkalihalobacillus sp. AL-G]